MENIHHPHILDVIPVHHKIGQSHPPIDPPADSYRLQTSPLRGFIHCASESLLFGVKPGTALTLVAEPANPHDKYAVRVHLGKQGEHHIGYLPRQSNHVVSRLLRQGAPLRAEVAWVSPHLDPRHPLSLHVLLPKNTEKPKKKAKK